MMADVIGWVDHLLIESRPLVLAVAWQAAALFLAAALATKLLSQASPLVRSWLWRIVALKLALMPFWTWIVEVPAAPFPSPSVAQGGDASSPVALTPFTLESHVSPPAESAARSLFWSRWDWWLASAWIVWILIRARALGAQRSALQRLLRETEQASQEIQQCVDAAAQQLGLGRSLPVAVTSECHSPFVCGLWRPLLVLPAALCERFDKQQLEHIALHELTHIRRGDLWWIWVGEWIRCCYFIHPAGIWASRRMRWESELACDHLAVRHSGRDAGGYAETLVRTARFTMSQS